MYLKSLEMQGFKSFPDKTKLNFGRGMTAVVGPNGSGKSNISDAVRWVLGEQSSKSLRGSKMEDVIFSGTPKRNAVGFAEVTLCLDNTDRALDIDKDEVSVSRRYYRSGESEYKINNVSVRLKDVNELFMDTGLGRDGYSLVSQGQIEHMVSAKSTDRREMFEEAAGISHYRYRREDALRKLDAAEDNMIRLKDILSELASRVGPLKIQSAKAQEFLRLSGEKKDLEIGLWLDVLNKSQEKIRQQINSISIVSSQYDEIVNELNDIVSKEQESDEQSRELNLLLEAHRADAQKHDENAAAKESLIAVNRNSIKNNEESIEKTKIDKKNENKSFDEIDEAIEKKKEERNNVVSQMELLKNEMISFSDSLTSFNEQGNELSGQVKALSEKSSELTRQIAAQKMIAQNCFSSVQEIVDRRSSVKTETENLKKQLEQLNTKVDELKAEQEKNDEEIKSTLNEISARIIKTQSKESRVLQLKFEEDKTYLDLQQKKNRLKMITDMEKNMDGYQAAVKSVMVESSGGRLSGIHGPLSTLIKTEDEYTVAIETALGQAIQDIVTDTEDDAKKAMNFLKREDLGRATFLPISSITGRYLQDDDLRNESGFIDVASDLVDFDDEYLDIVDSLLGKVVVCDTLESAIEIGRKYEHKFKIVTLDGQVMNPGGSMTGGSKLQHSGFLERANKKEHLSVEINELTEKLEKTKSDAKKSKDEFDNEKYFLDLSRERSVSLNEKKISLSGEITLNTDKTEFLQSQVNQLENESLTSAQKQQTLKEEGDKANENVSLLETELHKLNDKYTSVFKSKESVDDELKTIEEKINQSNLKKVAFEKTIENIDDSIKELENRKNDQGNRIQRLDDEIDTLTHRNDTLRERIAELENLKDEIQHEKKIIDEKIIELSEKRDKLEGDSSSRRIHERELNDLKEKISGELIRLDEKKNALISEQTDTEQKLYDEYHLSRAEAERLEIRIDNLDEATKQLRSVRSKIKSLGNVNTGAIEEYKEVNERYTFMSEQLDDVEKSKEELKKMIYDLTDSMSTQFLQRFEQINKYFSETFVELFGGGRAELILENDKDVLESGIEIKAQPPGKNVKNLSLLSGGEKGLTAIALLFAMMKVSPAPFCIFDEVEAALDDVNVLRYAKYIRGMTEKTQFILITHRRGTMEESDVMYGVTMQDQGVSKLLQLETTKMSKELGID